MFIKYSLLCCALISCYTLPHNVQEELRHNTIAEQPVPVINNAQYMVSPQEAIIGLLAQNKASIASKKEMLDRFAKSNDRVRTNYFRLQVLQVVFAIILQDPLSLGGAVFVEFAKRKSLYTQQDFDALQEQIKQDALSRQKLKTILFQTNTQY